MRLSISISFLLLFFILSPNASAEIQKIREIELSPLGNWVYLSNGDVVDEGFRMVKIYSSALELKQTLYFSYPDIVLTVMDIKNRRVAIGTSEGMYVYEKSELKALEPLGRVDTIFPLPNGGFCGTDFYQKNYLRCWDASLRLKFEYQGPDFNSQGQHIESVRGFISGEVLVTTQERQLFILSSNGLLIQNFNYGAHEYIRVSGPNQRGNYLIHLGIRGNNSSELMDEAFEISSRGDRVYELDLRRFSSPQALCCSVRLLPDDQILVEAQFDGVYLGNFNQEFKKIISFGSGGYREMLLPSGNLFFEESAESWVYVRSKEAQVSRFIFPDSEFPNYRTRWVGEISGSEEMVFAREGLGLEDPQLLWADATGKILEIDFFKVNTIGNGHVNSDGTVLLRIDQRIALFRRISNHQM